MKKSSDEGKVNALVTGEKYTSSGVRPSVTSKSREQRL